MQEHELNTIMDVVSVPIKNVYDISSYKNVAEIQRMIRIFKINEEQNMKTKMFAIKNLATFNLVLSNN